jgi:hypothetical protein
MKKIFATAAIVLLAGVSPAQAGEFGDLRAQASAARSSLIAFMLHTDQRGAAQQKQVKDTADAVSESLAKMKAPAGKEAQFKELKETWAAFKKTRETELVPLLLKGKEEEAKKLGGGIQKERYLKISDLINELDQ